MQNRHLGVVLVHKAQTKALLSLWAGGPNHALMGSHLLNMPEAQRLKDARALHPAIMVCTYKMNNPCSSDCSVALRSTSPP